jgi:hypothetical protein
MTSRVVCNIDACKRSAYALCYCCQQDFCMDHLNNHADLSKLHLPLLVDKINILFEQFHNVSPIEPSLFAELDQWRQEAHRAVDCFYERKKQEFQECLQEQRNKQKVKLDQLKNQINKLVEQSGATNENIRSIETSLQSLQLQVDGNNSPRFILSPLVIKNRLVVIDRNLLRLNDLLSSSPLSRMEAFVFTN